MSFLFDFRGRSGRGRPHGHNSAMSPMSYFLHHVPHELCLTAPQHLLATPWGSRKKQKHRTVPSHTPGVFSRQDGNRWGGRGPQSHLHAEPQTLRRLAPRVVRVYLRKHPQPARACATPPPVARASADAIAAPPSKSFHTPHGTLPTPQGTRPERRAPCHSHVRFKNR